MSGVESRAVDVVRVRNALITHSFVASKNVAVSEDNASLHGRSDSIYPEPSDGKKPKFSLLSRRSTNRDKDPVNPFLRLVLQALMHVLRPSELCRLLTTLQTASTLSRKNAGLLESISSLPNVLDLSASLLPIDGSAKENEYFVALISNRLSGVEEDALFLLRAVEVENGKGPKSPKTKKRLSLRKTKSLERFSSSRRSAGRESTSSSKKEETEGGLQRKQTFVTDSLAQAPQVGVELTIIKILPIWSDLRISLKGRGLIRLNSSGESLRIGTVSIASMWRLVMALNRAKTIAKANNLFPQGPSHKWVSAYTEPRLGSMVQDKVDQPEDPSIKEIDDNAEPVAENNNEEYYDDEGDSSSDNGSSTSCSVKTSSSRSLEWGRGGPSRAEPLSGSPAPGRLSARARARVEREFVEEIRTIIQNTLNLDDLTTQDVISALEKKFGKTVVSQFKKAFIDEIIIQIYGQQDPPSLIESWLYLGTEYNASNFSELQQLGITNIVNVTKEIKNFFPDVLDYHRISVKDKESADLLSHLEPICKTIKALESQGKKVLVHCQRGISRSATVVIAYLMYRDNLKYEDALDLVKQRRSIIKPNKGFVKQLQKFEASCA